MKVVRDVLGGTLRLRALGKEYLPSFPKEDEKIYKARLRASVLFNATKRTLKAFSGMIFRKEIEVGDDVHERIVPHLDNIDLTGRDLDTFARANFEDAEADGHACIFVDMQPPVEGAESPIDEEAAGLRPYWVTIRKQDILAFDTELRGGVTVLTGLRYHETSTERNGFTEHEVHRIREYWLDIEQEEGGEAQQVVRYRIWRLKEDVEYPGEAGDWDREGEDKKMVGRSTIPLAVTYTGRTGYMESDPPLLDLALENIKHYQTDSDNQNLARTAKVQTLVITGESKDNVHSVAIGPGNAIVLEDSDSDAKWIGADGSSFSVFLDDLDNIEKRMAIMGLSMLMSDTRAAETAASKRIDKSESDSQLAASAKSLEAALNHALKLHAEWLDIEDGGHVGVNTDFETEPLSAEHFREFRELWGERGISWDSLMAILNAGDVMPEGFDIEEERQRLADEAGADIQRTQEAMFGDEDDGDEDEEEEDDDGEPPVAA